MVRIFWGERMMNMEHDHIFLAGSTQACRFAGEYLRQLGLPVTDKSDDLSGYVLLDVPCFTADGKLRSGGDPQALLSGLSPKAMICGGRLNHPALQDRRTVDFLRDEIYQCENAYITAECALDVALPYLKRTLRGCPVLIIGWGRIGKCLGQLLKAMGADVTIAARNPGHRAMIHALGCHAEAIEGLNPSHYRLIYNTVPFPVLSREQMAHCREDCVKIELASANGMEGEDIIIARGLPGIHMPESSGELIAKTFLRLCYGR